MTKISNSSLRVAFIGGALNSAVGYTHFNASRLDGHFKVVSGCFSRNINENHNTAKVYGVDLSRCYLDWKHLINCEKGLVDAVVVLTPTPTHFEIVKCAIEAGYPVICEKALAVSSYECEQIATSIRKNNGYLAVTYNYSGYPMIRQLQREILDGRLGVLQQIHIEMPQEGFLRLNANPQNWRRVDYAVPTVSLDLGVHVHHLIDFLSDGLKPIEVFGEQSTYGLLHGVVDNVYCISRYEENLRVIAWWGKTALGYRNGLRLRVFGDRGSADWYQMDPEVLRLADNDGHFYQIDRGSGDAKIAQEKRYNRFKAGHPSGFVEAFANLYADFADEISGILEGRKVSNPYVFGAKQAEDGMLFIEAISNSAKDGNWISLR